MPSNIPLSILKIKQWVIIRLSWLLLVLFGPFLWLLDYQSFLDSSKIDFQTLCKYGALAMVMLPTLVTSSNVAACVKGMHECITIHKATHIFPYFLILKVNFSSLHCSESQDENPTTTCEFHNPDFIICTSILSFYIPLIIIIFINVSIFKV